MAEVADSPTAVAAGGVVALRFETNPTTLLAPLPDAPHNALHPATAARYRPVRPTMEDQRRVRLKRRILDRLPLRTVVQTHPVLALLLRALRLHDDTSVHATPSLVTAHVLPHAPLHGIHQRYR